ncbi:MAG: hypothetical protein JST58_17155 [Bacteroidetes bacterium]|nr:hypothetical protein [Bacteroidota bacterium]
MKKNGFLLFYFVLLTVSCTAQPHAPKLSAQILIGPSFPLGEFASKAANGLYVSDYYTKASGWANPGFSGKINLDYQIKKSFGISLIIAGQENKQDKNALENNVRQGTNNTDNYSITTNPWKIFRAMAAVYYDFHIPDGKLLVRPRISAGALKTNIPAYRYFDMTSFSSGGYMNQVSVPILFCYGIGTDLQRPFSKKMFLVINFDFFHSTIKGYNVQGSTVNGNFNTQIPISSFNTFFGVGYRL